MRRRSNRPGNLRDLADSWVNIQAEKELARAATQGLEAQSTAYIDSRSGAAITDTMRGIRAIGPQRLSSPDFLIRNAGWYREYMRKVMG